MINQTPTPMTFATLGHSIATNIRKGHSLAGVKQTKQVVWANLKRWVEQGLYTQAEVDEIVKHIKKGLER